MFPKWVMNSESNLIPTGVLLRRARFWQYQRLVKNTYGANLVRYWPLRDTSGTVARDVSRNMGNATYSGVTLKQVGIGDGHQCPLFGTSFVNCYSAAFNTVFPRAAGTIAVWAKVANAGVWNDGLNHRICAFLVNTNNYVYIIKSSVNNTLRCLYRANGATEELIQTGLYAFTTWLNTTLTWDSVADQLRFYVNGTLIDTNVTIGGAITGNLSSAASVLGANDTTPTQPWSGYLAHAAIWNVALPAQSIKRLSRF